MRIITAAVLAGLAMVSGTAIAQETFDIDFSSDGETVTGSILLASGTTGSVQNNSIDGYSLTGSGAVDFSYTDVPVPSPPLPGMGGGALDAQNGNLYFDPAPWYLGPTGDIVTATSSNGFGPLTFCGGGCPDGGSGRTGGPGMIIYGHSSTGSPVMGGFSLADGSLIGTSAGSAAAAPEIDPNGALAGLTLLLGGLLVLRGRAAPH